MVASRQELTEKDPILTLGRYALHGEIASGGMATVHFGRMSSLGGFSRTVAIKRMRRDIAMDPEFVAMFLDEARLASRVEHPNVVATLDVVADGGEVFLVMEYVRGESLSKLIRALRISGEQAPLPIAISIICGCLTGLHAAHEALGEGGAPLGIIHRDVSPQNILVGEDGITRINDFGIAKAESRLQITRDGMMKGKLCYMAPEQLARAGRLLDRRVDIFACGVVAWELLSGKKLFQADHPGETMANVLNAPIPPLTGLRDDVSMIVDRTVRKALARNPDHRWNTAEEFAQALEDATAIASNRVVGNWVTRIAGDVLANRHKYVREIESIGGASGTPISQILRTPPASSEPAVSQDPPRTPLPAAGSPPPEVPRPPSGAGPLVAPPRVPRAEPLAAPAPQPLAAPIPQPLAAPTPQPLAAPIPQPLAAPTPQPLAAAAPRPIVALAPEQPIAAPSPQPKAPSLPRVPYKPSVPKAPAAPERTSSPALSPMLASAPPQVAPVEVQAPQGTPIEVQPLIPAPPPLMQVPSPAPLFPVPLQDSLASQSTPALVAPSASEPSLPEPLGSPTSTPFVPPGVDLSSSPKPIPEWPQASPAPAAGWEPTSLPDSDLGQSSADSDLRLDAKIFSSRRRTIAIYGGAVALLGLSIVLLIYASRPSSQTSTPPVGSGPSTAAPPSATATSESTAEARPSATAIASEVDTSAPQIPSASSKASTKTKPASSPNTGPGTRPPTGKGTQNYLPDRP